MKNTKIIILVSILAISSLIIISAVVGRNIYKENLKKNVNIYISSVTLIENSDDSDNEEVYGLLSQFFNQTVNDICVHYDMREGAKEISEAEKVMKFDLNTFNVYKIEIACNKREAAADKYVFARETDFCQESKYMKVPCNVSSNICSENTLYYFVSKEYNEEDVKQYLKKTGSSIYVCIGKDELRPIVKYNKTIFFSSEKISTTQ